MEHKHIRFIKYTKRKFSWWKIFRENQWTWTCRKSGIKKAIGKSSQETKIWTKNDKKNSMTRKCLKIKWYVIFLDLSKYLVNI